MRLPVHHCPIMKASASVLIALALHEFAAAAEILNSATLQKYVDPLPNPMNNVIAASGTLGGAPLHEISVTAFQQQLHRDLPATTLWGYNESFPGPTFVVDRGQTIKVRWTNNLVDSTGDPLQQHLLPYDTTLHGAHDHLPRARVVTHLHGSVTDEFSDGYPEYWFSPDPNAPPNGLGGPAGNSMVTTYPNNQRATTLLYHDHAMGITRLNVYAGMSGFYLIRDPIEQGLNLPSGPYDVPLLLQDRTFYDDGQLYYPDGLSSLPATDEDQGGHGGHGGGGVPEGFPSQASVVPHFFGNANLVNGAVWPYLEVEPRKYRFRLLNGANSRAYNLVLDAGTAGSLAFHQIGTDGGLLANRTERAEVFLGSADRADVIVDFSQFNVGDEIYLRNTGPDAEVGRMNVPADPNTTGQVMQFRVVAPSGPDSSSLPEALSTIERYRPEDAVRTRVLSLDLLVDEYGRPELLLNRSKWTDPITEMVRLGDLEIWQFVNRTSTAHPIHLHMDHFQILERFIRGTGPVPLAPHELGWEDTVMVGAGENVSIMVKFDQYTGKFVWHCHLLEHEDSEMMRPFVILPTIVPEPSRFILLAWGLTWIALVRRNAGSKR
ncbi:MAG TPA: multicopper oxidase domain-containing protein [Lacipirellulaceae bacterium]